jgi:hypothetical protein
VLFGYNYLLLKDFGPYMIIFMGYNRYHGNAVERFRALCVLSVCMLVGW